MYVYQTKNNILLISPISIASVALIGLYCVRSRFCKTLSVFTTILEVVNNTHRFTTCIVFKFIEMQLRMFIKNLTVRIYHCINHYTPPLAITLFKNKNP